MNKLKFLVVLIFIYSVSVYANTTQKNQLVQILEEARKDYNNKKLNNNNQDFYTLKIDLKTTLTDAKGLPYILECNIIVGISKNTDINKFEHKKYIFKDILIIQLSARSLEEMLTVGGKNMLREELIENFNKLIFNKSSVKSIYYDKFLIIKKI